MWYVLLVILASIGAAVVAFVVGLFVEEVWRAGRQSLRVAAVAIRVHLADRRRVSCREWWRAFKRELFSSYSSLIIGFIEIPRDPSKPLRARLPG